MKTSALLFDLDGTLVDSVPDLARALNGILEESGAPPLSLAEVKLMVGDGAPALVARALAARKLPPDDDGTVLARFLGRYEADPTSSTEVYPGVLETAAALRDEGWKLGIVTNKPERAARLVVDQLGLSAYFSVIIGGDSTPWRKPDPRPLGAALDALGGTRAVFVGDSENDAAAARAAGFPVVLVRYGYARSPIEGLGATALIDRFDELPAALAAIRP